MKVTRNKNAKKILNQYKVGFGFQKPLQILVDGTFCHFGIFNKIHLKEHLEKYLNSPVNICTTKCIMKEVESLGEDFIGTRLQMRKHNFKNCQHEPLLSVENCLKDLIGTSNSNKFIVATQDVELKKLFRNIPGVPLLFISKSVILLEHLSIASHAELKKKLNAIESSNQEQTTQTTIPSLNKRKKKGNKNPLACKISEKKKKEKELEKKKIKNQKRIIRRMKNKEKRLD